METIKYQNDVYKVILADIKDQSGTTSLGYQTINKETGVVEFETFAYIEALTVARDASKLLQDFFDEAEVQEVVPLHS